MYDADGVLSIAGSLVCGVVGCRLLCDVWCAFVRRPKAVAYCVSIVYCALFGVGDDDAVVVAVAAAADVGVACCLMMFGVACWCALVRVVVW